MGFEWFGDLGAVLPFVGMVTVNLAMVSNLVVMKAALSRGLDKHVLIVYSNCLSSLIFFFCSIIFHRSKSSRPPLTFNIVCGFIFISLLGFVGQLCGYAGIQYSSPTLGTAECNLIPAFTFILATIFRMEKLEWRRSSSQAKVVGTIVSIAGAFVVTLYKGPVMMKIKTLSLTSSSHQQPNWVLGGFLFAIEALTVSAIYIVEVLLLKTYMAPLLMLFYSFSFSTILSTIYCVIVVQDSTAWRLRLDMGLVSILLAGFTTALCVGVSLWCLWKTGPLYVSMFKPLGIIFSAVMTIVFLGDAMCLGSLIGAVMTAVGFYLVLWGKAKEKEMGKGVEPSSNSIPLLQDTIEEM